MSADIFISYSTQDRPRALALCETLRASGQSVWIDQIGIEAATNWSDEIAKALEACATFILLLSPSSVRSKNVLKELSLAAEADKRIIPVEVEKVAIPSTFKYHLAGLQRVAIDETDAILKAVTRPAELATGPAEERPAGRLRLAVLPFDDLSPEKNNDWFADGLMDELINTLGSLDQLHVAPRSDVIYYKKHKPNPAELVSDLSIDFMVEGSVQKSGDKIRIRVALTDARKHKLIWSEKYDGIFGDIFDLEDKTCHSITEALKLKLTPEQVRKIDIKPTENADAYELFLKADEYFQRHRRADLERAMVLQEAAIRLDPSFSLAHIHFANTANAYYRSYGGDPSILERMEEHIDAAEALGAPLERIYNERGNLALRRGDVKEALRLAQQAVEIAPNYPKVYDTLSFAWHALGNLDEVAKARRRLIELDPNDRTSHFNYLVSLKELGHTERLREAARNAIPIFQRHIRLNPEAMDARVEYAGILAMVGHVQEALKEVDRLAADEDAMDGSAFYNLACLLITVGQQDRATQALRKSIERGFLNPEAFYHDPDLDPVRNTPEFEGLLQDLKAKIAQVKS